MGMGEWVGRGGGVRRRGECAGRGGASVKGP